MADHDPRLGEPDDDPRLGELLGMYQRLRAEDPRVDVEALREEAGPLYPALVELAPCLDLVVGDSSVLGVAEPSARPAAGRMLRRWMLAGVLVVGLAGAWWFLRPDRTPLRLRVTCIPSADTALDGAPLVEFVTAGVHELRATRSGFHPIVRQVDVADGDLEITLYLEPIDPFDAEALEALTSALGITHRAPSDALPHPVNTDEPNGDALISDPTPAEAMAMQLELARLPRELQASPSGLYIIAERLYRMTHYRMALRTAMQLVDTHPNRKAPLRLALHALWGLDQSTSARYRELYARYLSAD